MEANKRACDPDQCACHVAVPGYELPAKPRLAVSIVDEPGNDPDRQDDEEICDTGGYDRHQVRTISRARRTSTMAPIAATTICATTGSPIGIRMLSAENR